MIVWQLMGLFQLRGRFLAEPIFAGDDCFSSFLGDKFLFSSFGGILIPVF